MHRYEELEKLYYKKKTIKVLSITIILILCIIGGVVLKNKLLCKIPNTASLERNIENNTSKKEDINKTLKINKKIDDLNKTEKNNGKKIKKEPLEISFDVPNIKDDEVRKKIKKIDNNKKSKKSSEKKEKIKYNTLPIPKPIYVIKETEINVKDFIKKFNKKPQFDMAMLISNYYYNHNNLEAAKEWALKANSINPSNYESWKMFALILIKKKNKAKAKEVLNIYLNDYGYNDEINKLLRSLDE
ncbi:MAG: hypothetical protein ABGX26_04145 [Nautiliaceae bacterium]